jgi:hypothetical protein
MHLIQSHARRLLRAAGYLPLLAALLSFGACNSSEGSTGLSPDFTADLALSADSVQVAIGDSLSVAVTITRGGGYVDPVTLAIDTLTLPTGVTARFEPQVLGLNITASVLTLTINANAVTGLDSLVVRAAGFGVADDTTVVQLNVVAPAIGMTSVVTAASAAIGSTASIPLTFQRVNGYAGPIFLTAEGVPANVTATFIPAQVPNGVTNSTLTLTPIEGATVGTSTITVRAANGSIVLARTVPFTFTITPGNTTDYSPSVSPAALNVVTGASAQTEVSVNRMGGFTGDVMFTVTGLPSGVTAAFTPTPATAGTTTLLLTAASDVVVGTYNLTVTGSAAGLPNHSIPLVLTVAPPPALSLTVLTPTLTVAKGAIGQSNLILTRTGGLVGDVRLSTEGVPAGVSSIFLPATMTGAATSSIVTFSVGAGATNGTYTIVVRGDNSAAGVSGTSTLTLVVGP